MQEMPGPEQQVVGNPCGGGPEVGGGRPEDSTVVGDGARPARAEELYHQ